MRRRLLIGALSMLFGRILYAQDIAGDWQGTLKTGTGEIRLLITIVKGQDGGWKAKEFTPDEGSNGLAANSVTLQGSDLKLIFDRIRGTYDGKISEDRTTVAGTWTQGRSLPLELKRATEETSWRRDTTPHHSQFITVEDSVRLEVLDWGGSGRPVVLLAGGGNNAHGYDKFAPKLIGSYHVYGITRRGFGASSVPAPTSVNYSADRLGDDVLAVIDALKLNRPVLVGHSLAGEELSSVGSRHPEKVAGLIYLDAGYSYAYYDSARGDFNLDRADLQRRLERLQPGKMPQDPRALIRELLETSLPQFEKDLRELQKRMEAAPAPPVVSVQPQPAAPTVDEAILSGMQKYTDIRVPILAIYALPHDRGITDPVARAAADASDLAFQGAMAKAFEKGLPSARVLWLAHASHYVFRSNEADVLREMNAFIGNLP